MAQNWREIGWGQQYPKTDSKRFLSKLSNEYKIWFPNYQNTTGSEKAPRAIIHQGYYIIKDNLSFEKIVNN